MAKIIVLVGPPGSGKSTLAKDLIANEAATIYRWRTANAI